MTSLLAKCCCIVFLVLWIPGGCNGEEITAATAYYAKLDDNYDLNWNFNSTHILFQTKTKTPGYIGFGISSSGRMYPGDVIIGWVRHGVTHFADRFAAGHFTPIKDLSQDWTLLTSSKADGYLTFLFVRALDTKDERGDIQITWCPRALFHLQTGPTDVIYCYSPISPINDNDVTYHLIRGSRSLSLLNPPADMKVVS